MLRNDWVATLLGLSCLPSYSSVKREQDKIRENKQGGVLKHRLYEGLLVTLNRLCRTIVQESLVSDPLAQWFPSFFDW